MSWLANGWHWPAAHQAGVGPAHAETRPASVFMHHQRREKKMIKTKKQERRRRRRKKSKTREYQCSVFISASDGMCDLNTSVCHGNVSPALASWCACTLLFFFFFFFSFLLSSLFWQWQQLLPWQISHEGLGGVVFLHLPLGCCCGGQQQIIIDVLVPLLFGKILPLLPCCCVLVHSCSLTLLLSLCAWSCVCVHMHTNNMEEEKEKKNKEHQTLGQHKLKPQKRFCVPSFFSCTNMCMCVLCPLCDQLALKPTQNTHTHTHTHSPKRQVHVPTVWAGQKNQLACAPSLLMIQSLLVQQKQQKRHTMALCE
jgi:hypothetical protein